jgi:hypothetical protein
MTQRCRVRQDDRDAPMGLYQSTARVKGQKSFIHRLIGGGRLFPAAGFDGSFSRRVSGMFVIGYFASQGQHSRPGRSIMQVLCQPGQRNSAGQQAWNPWQAFATPEKCLLVATPTQP